MGSNREKSNIVIFHILEAPILISPTRLYIYKELRELLMVCKSISFTLKKGGLPQKKVLLESTNLNYTKLEEQ